MQHIPQDEKGPSTSSLTVCLEQILDAHNRTQSSIAEAQLVSFQQNFQILPQLLEIISQPHLPSNIRILSAIHVKNGIEKEWRRKFPKPIELHLKHQIRTCLLALSTDPIPQIASPMSVTISKIARHDFPTEWPDLFQQIFHSIQNQGSSSPNVRPLTLERNVQLLYDIIKLLGSQALPARRKIFKELAIGIFSPILSILKACYSLPHSESVLRSIVYCVKCLLKLFVSGFKNDMDILKSTSSNPVTLEINIFPALLAEYLVSIQSTWPHGDLRDKLIRNIGKVYIECIVHMPFKFLISDVFFPHCQKFLLYLLDAQKGDVLCLTSMLVLTSLLKRFRAQGEQGKLYVEKIFSPELVQTLYQKISRSIALMSEEEQMTWDTAPEEFILEWQSDSLSHEDTIGSMGNGSGSGGKGASEHLDFFLRRSSECFLVTLFCCFKTELLPELASSYAWLSSLLQSDTLHTKTVNEQILNLLNILSLLSSSLYDLFDVDTFLEATILPKIARLEKSSERRLLLLRACQFIEAWFPVKLCVNLRPFIFALFETLLKPSEDLVVRFFAASALKAGLHEYHFDPRQIESHLHGTCLSLLQLIADLKDFELQTQALSTLSLLFQKMNVKANKMALSIAEQIPRLWIMAAENYLMKSGILGLASSLLESLGTSSSILSPLFEQMITFSTLIESNESVYLLEDGLRLWLVMLQHSETFSDCLQRLLPMTVKLLEISSEKILTVIKIIDAYVAFAPSGLLESWQAIFHQLAAIVEELNPETWPCIADLCSIFIQTYGDTRECSALNLVLQSIFRILLNERSHPIYMSSLYVIFSRLIISNAHYYHQFIVHIHAEPAFGPGTEIAFLSLWLDKFDTLNSTKEKMETLMAWMMLLRQGHPVLLEKFDLFTNACVSLIFDDDLRHFDYCLIKMHPILDKIGQNEDQKRRNRLLARDPVMFLVFVVNLEELWQYLESCLGPCKYKTMIETIHPINIKNIKEAFESKKTSTQ